MSLTPREWQGSWRGESLTIPSDELSHAEDIKTVCGRTSGQMTEVSGGSPLAGALSKFSLAFRRPGANGLQLGALVQVGGGLAGTCVPLASERHLKSTDVDHCFASAPRAGMVPHSCDAGRPGDMGSVIAGELLRMA